MALQIAFFFQSTDSTALLNQRLARLMGKGIYDGGVLSPVGGTLTAQRTPFFAIGRDGITIWDDETTTLTYTDGIANYHVIRARYNPLGTPSSPVMSEEILTAAQYSADPELAYLVLLAIVTPSGGEVTTASISYALRDEVGPFGRNFFKGVVDDETDLPTGIPNFNRTGDMYRVINDPAPGGHGLYTWSGSAWRLVAAAGAGTLDGAYDNNGTSPGAGREITVDSQAVELIQDTASQRQNDVANAALRIRKTGSTANGDGALDIALAQDRDSTSLLIRSKYVISPHVEADEPVNLTNPNTITTTRGTAAWNNAAVRKPSLMFVEITGSSSGNDGLFLVGSATGATTATALNLDGSTASFTNENGVTANFFSPRLTFGASLVGTAVYDLGAATKVGSIEYFGGIPAAGGVAGRLTYVNLDGAIGATGGPVWSVRLFGGGVGATSTAAFDVYADGSYICALGTARATFLGVNSQFGVSGASNLTDPTLAVLGDGSSNPVLQVTSTGSNEAIEAINTAGSGAAITAAGGSGAGVSATSSGYGVDAQGDLAGVRGRPSDAGATAGVFGTNSGTGVQKPGVVGESNSGSAGGVEGTNTMGYAAVRGSNSAASAAGAFGVHGLAVSTNTGSAGVKGESSDLARGVWGQNNGDGIGVYGTAGSAATSIGVYGSASGSGLAVNAAATGSAIGLNASSVSGAAVRATSSANDHDYESTNNRTILFRVPHSYGQSYESNTGTTAPEWVLKNITGADIYWESTTANGDLTFWVPIPQGFKVTDIVADYQPGSTGVANMRVYKNEKLVPFAATPAAATVTQQGSTATSDGTSNRQVLSVASLSTLFNPHNGETLSVNFDWLYVHFDAGNANDRCYEVVILGETKSVSPYHAPDAA